MQKTRLFLILTIIFSLGAVSIPRVYAGESAQTTNIGDKIFLILEVPKEEVYSNEKVSIVVSLYINGLSVGDVEYPTLKGSDFTVGEYDKPTQYKKVVEKISYDVVEFNTSFIPQKSGQMSLTAELSCNLLVKSSSDNVTEKRPVLVNSQESVVNVLEAQKGSKEPSFLGTNDVHPQITEEAIMDMSKAYSYYRGQKNSVERITELFPEKGGELIPEQLKFDSKFGKSIDMIDSVLKNQFGEWEKAKEEMLRATFESLDFSKLSESALEEFARDIKDRNKGNIPSPILETLLIYNPSYIENPSREFRDGYKDVYRTKDHPKAKGVDFQIEFPKSWKNEEGLRPNIIQKFTSENGRGLEGIMLAATKLPVPEGYALSEEDVEEFFTDESIKGMIPKGGEFIKFVPTVVEGLKSGLLYFKQRQQRLNVVVNTKTVFFLTAFDDKLINIQCHAGVQGENENLLNDRFNRIEPLFMEVLNSLVIHDKWEKASNFEGESQAQTALGFVFGNPWWLMLIVSFVLTWGIGLIPPLFIRFVLVRKSLSKAWAITLVSIFWFINIGIFTALESKSKTHAALFLVAWVSYVILKKKNKGDKR